MSRYILWDYSDELYVFCFRSASHCLDAYTDQHKACVNEHGLTSSNQTDVKGRNLPNYRRDMTDNY